MEKNIIVGKLERRVSKKTGSIYYCINCYVKVGDEIKCISSGKPIYVDSDKLELLTKLYGLDVIDAQ